MNIKLFIQKNIDQGFSPEDDLPFPTLTKTVPKNTILTHYNRTEHHAYFLIQGIVKISMVTELGQERVLEFFFPGAFFSAYTSFLTQQPSNVEIETLTECEVEVIHYRDMQEAYKTSLLANKLGRMAAEYYYILKTNREKDFLTKSASDRYKELLDKRPELLQQIPVQFIAKYLGIEPESLSRIRKSMH